MRSNPQEELELNATVPKPDLLGQQQQSLVVRFWVGKRHFWVRVPPVRHFYNKERRTLLPPPLGHLRLLVAVCLVLSFSYGVVHDTRTHPVIVKSIQGVRFHNHLGTLSDATPPGIRPCHPRHSYYSTTTHSNDLTLGLFVPNRITYFPSIFSSFIFHGPSSIFHP